MAGSQLQEDMVLIHFSPEILALEKEVTDCRKCRGLNIPKVTEGTSGYGSKFAKLMVVGQSLHGYNDQTPGRQIPFVGPVASCDSGQLLYDMLRQAGYTINAGNLYVTNLVKCHPPRNRPSNDREIKNCQPYLLRELNDIVKNAHILMVGSSALHWFLRQYSLRPGVSIGMITEWQLPPQIPVIESRRYFSIKHPSAILRFNNITDKEIYKRDIVNCLSRVRRSQA